MRETETLRYPETWNFLWTSTKELHFNYPCHEIPLTHPQPCLPWQNFCFNSSQGSTGQLLGKASAVQKHRHSFHQKNNQHDKNLISDSVVYGTWGSQIPHPYRPHVGGWGAKCSTTSWIQSGLPIVWNLIKWLRNKAHSLSMLWALSTAEMET